MAVKNNLHRALLFILLLAGFTFRWVDLRADPPANFSTSGGDYLDGMANAHTARQYVKFGQWRADDWDTYIYAPTFTLLQTLWFRVAGISVSSNNAFGALFSSLTLFGLIWAVHRSARDMARQADWPLLAGLFCAGSAVLVAYGRLALFENVLLFFLVAGTLGLRTTSPWGAALVGLGSFLAYATKAIGLYALPAGLMGALWCGLSAASPHTLPSPRVLLRQASAWLSGTLVVALPWWFGFRRPNHETIQHFGNMWTELSLPNSLAEALLNTSRTPIFHAIGQHDLVLACAVLTVGWLAWRVLVAPGEIPPLVVFCATWLLGGIALTAPLSYSPTRYFYPLFPAAAVVAAYGLTRLLRAAELKAVRFKPWLLITLGVTGALVVRFVVLPHTHWTDLLPETWPRSYRALAIAAVLSALGVVVSHAIAARVSWSSAWSLRLRQSVVVLIAAHYLYGNLTTLQHRYERRDHSIRRAARFVATLPSNTVVGGTCALAAVMESPFPAVRIGKPGWYNDDWPQRQPPVTHLFLTDFAGERQRFRKLHPDILNTCTTVRTFKVCGYPFYLLARTDLPGSSVAP